MSLSVFVCECVWHYISVFWHLRLIIYMSKIWKNVQLFKKCVGMRVKVCLPVLKIVCVCVSLSFYLLQKKNRCCQVCFWAVWLVFSLNDLQWIGWQISVHAYTTSWYILKQLQINQMLKHTFNIAGHHSEISVSMWDGLCCFQLILMEMS